MNTPNKPTPPYEDPFTLGKRDFMLCGKMVDRIASKHAAETPVTSFSRPEQVVLLVWHTTGMVNDGGFENLFAHTLPGNEGHQLSPGAFTEIGCEEVAEILSQAIAANEQAGATSFKEGVPAGDRKRLNEEFWQYDWSSGPRDPITQALADYIRQHETELGPLP